MKLVQIIVLPSLLSVGLLLVGCQQREKKQQASATPPLQKSQFERDLEYVKRAQLTHTYVISRKDGAALDVDDKQFIARNVPLETSHRLVSDEDRRAIIGTNFDLYADNRKALEQRFIVLKVTGDE